MKYKFIDKKTFKEYKYITHDDCVYVYEYKTAKHKIDICLGTKDPEKYCNGYYLYSDKDPGSGLVFVVIATNNPELFNNENIIKLTLDDDIPTSRLFFMEGYAKAKRKYEISDKDWRLLDLIKTDLSNLLNSVDNDIDNNYFQLKNFIERHTKIIEI